MDELTEEELHGLQASSRPWHRLPDACTHGGVPLYLKTHVDPAQNVLIAILTDIRSSVWLEYFGDARALYFRIKVSARETAKSTYTDSKEKEAVAQLLSDMEAFPGAQTGGATLDVKSDSEMEVVLPLPGIHFRFRLDKVSSEAQALLLYELVYVPLLGIASAIQHSNDGGLQAIQHSIDQQSKIGPVGADGELLSALQRFCQGTSGVPVKSRLPISRITSAPGSTGSRMVPSLKKPSSKSSTTNAQSVDDTEHDGDKTMLSSPEPQAVKSPRSKRTVREESTSPTITGQTRAPGRKVDSPTPSPPISTRKKNKSRPRHIAESPVDSDDSDATQGSESGQSMAIEDKADEAPKPKGKRKAKEASPEKEQTPSQADASPQPHPSPKKKKRASTPPREASHPPSSPHGPILKRPAIGAARGMPPRRGKKPGMQWSNFG